MTLLPENERGTCPVAGGYVQLLQHLMAGKGWKKAGIQGVVDSATLLPISSCNVISIICCYYYVATCDIEF